MVARPARPPACQPCRPAGGGRVMAPLGCGTCWPTGRFSRRAQTEVCVSRRDLFRCLETRVREPAAGSADFRHHPHQPCRRGLHRHGWRDQGRVGDLPDRGAGVLPQPVRLRPDPGIHALAGPRVAAHAPPRRPFAARAVRRVGDVLLLPVVQAVAAVRRHRARPLRPDLPDRAVDPVPRRACRNPPLVGLHRRLHRRARHDPAGCRRVATGGAGAPARRRVLRLRHDLDPPVDRHRSQQHHRVLFHFLCDPRRSCDRAAGRRGSQNSPGCGRR